MRVVWNQQAIDDRIEIMVRRADYVGATSAIQHDDQIEAKGQDLAGVVTYKRGRIKGTREHVFSEQYIMVYRIDADVVEILSIVPTAVNWANSAKKIKPLMYSGSTNPDKSLRYTLSQEKEAGNERKQTEDFYRRAKSQGCIGSGQRLEDHQ